MEVYLPILKKDGQKKLRERRNTINNQRSGINVQLKKSKYSMASKNTKAKITLQQRFKEMLMVEDYHTDDSMKNIDFDDIKEDQSDEDEDPNKVQKKHKLLEKLGNFTNPIEHY